jgi:hypothetical protein
MAEPREIERHKEMYRGRSKAEIRRLLAGDYSMSHSAGHIALKELLAEIEQMEKDLETSKAHSHSERYHSERQRWVKIAAAARSYTPEAGEKFWKVLPTSDVDEEKVVECAAQINSCRSSISQTFEIPGLIDASLTR